MFCSEELEYDIEDIDIVGEVGSAREARFAVYWMTTTSISTSTSYTATVTFGSIICTPSGFVMSVCGKK